MRHTMKWVAAAVLAGYLLMPAGSCLGQAPTSHLAELHRSPQGTFYEAQRLPIDPSVKSVLAVILVGLTVIGFGSIMAGLGMKEHSTRVARAFVWVHRINGIVFAALAITIAQYCIRILGVYGQLDQAPVGLHILTAIPIVLLPLMKIVITSRYRGWESLLPAMGVTLLLLTWTTSTIIIIHYFVG